ncbi:ATP-binding protein [Bacillus inaquosorum]|uniref:ATP-binding protein n=1 Tax=Bacillus inaquosorum TaxID=483913 RepID=UPI00227E824E|nr:ATP-binding protein [Bacillus inaquosorum]MCY8175749.1 ATP-binding protein [Bacillus inaquosorum]MCY8791311.1 ATP-binding protein [Bacillus inaquosorum]MCY8845019.1 ATP-binding protein [Bacillus inaquosorum]MCY9086033.1 ATP-binding protein [Bacillus inaquosorum]MCY9383755.1 ATP-binding protein [Bacillus inaquosorum]
MSNIIGKVMSSSPNSIVISIDNLKILEDHKEKLQIGQYLKIADGNNNFIVTVINNIKVLDYNILDNLNLIIDSQPIGTIVDDYFQRGTKNLPVPTEPVYILSAEMLDMIFTTNTEYNFPIGALAQNNQIEVKVNGDKFFGKHVAIVGSTGAGKSCTVAKILQDTVGIKNNENINIEEQKNSHIIIFDIHSEYSSAFTLPNEQNFTLNNLSVDKMKLPYWLMNSEELESLFIESNENNSYNQIAMFKSAVILNKEKHNPTINEITYDTPVYFDIKEVYNYIENMNREVISKLTNENCPKLSDSTLIRDRKQFYFDSVLEFVSQSNAAANKASNGPFYGEFNRFLSRLEAKLSDKRLNFLLKPKKEDGSTYLTDDFEEIMKQFLGYLNKSNITIVDLSGVPFEVLSITVSLISRLVFDFSFHYSKIQHEKQLLNNIPVMIVCEEAHNYIPRTGGAEYNSSKKSIERISKEGRKYGISLMVVSQRPSEVSETVFAQCNNFVALRLTNQNDQKYIKSLLPDSTKGIGEILPNLGIGESIIVGDSVVMPTIVKMEKPNPEPKSQSVNFKKEWDLSWKEVTFSEIIRRWRKEEEV